MGSHQQLSLRWNQYHHNWERFVRRLKTGKMFTDVMVACDGEVFQLHRVVLASCSSYFEKTLQNIPSKEVPIVMLSGVSGLEMHTLVEFMYGGQATVEQAHLEGLLKAAERLQIRGLVKSAEDEDSDAAEEEPAPATTPDASRPPAAAEEGAPAPAPPQQYADAGPGDDGRRCSGAAGSEDRRCSSGGAESAESSPPPLVISEEAEVGGLDDGASHSDQLAMQSVLSADLDALRAASPPPCPLTVERPSTPPTFRLPSASAPLPAASVPPPLISVFPAAAAASSEQQRPLRAATLLGSADKSPLTPLDLPPVGRLASLYLRRSAAESPPPAPPADVAARVTLTPQPPPPRHNGHGYRPLAAAPDAYASPYGSSKRNTSDSPHVQAALRRISAGEITVAEASIRYDIPIPTLYVNMRRQGVKARGRVGSAGQRKPRGVMSVEMRSALEEIRAGTITASKASRKYNITLPRLSSWMRKTGVRSAFAKGPQVAEAPPLPPPPVPPLLPRLPDAATLFALQQAARMA